MLEEVGVPEPAERLYRALLRDPGQSREELAAVAAPAPLDELLAALAGAGLVADAGDPHPADPRVAVRALVRQRQDSLDQVTAAMGELVADFTEGAQRTGGLVEVVNGERALRASLVDITASARQSVSVLDAPPYLDVSVSSASERALLSRGVTSRAIYAISALEVPGYLDTIQAMIAGGEEARVLPAVPLKLIVVDGARALLPLSVRDGRLTSGVLVQPSTLASALAALFDALWAQAGPVPGQLDGPEELDAVDRELLTLLASGLKDETIARKLGVSPRTLGRRITRLLERLGATSRFHAGLQAARRGWI
ncbi:LuxR C-terminal-related transcriptional regulator [Nonomuraea sp. NPDC059194]|uniref:helix-turn-helix transcriptional regulator n=1 Tax=Nonomuraea sp. NPDC059194 TaxID=3346764 RepID=UPI003690ADAA